MSKKVKVYKDGNFLRIDNKWYQCKTNEDGDFNTGEFEFIEVDKRKFDRKAKLVIDKLFSFVDPKLVLKDALKDLTEDEMDKLYKHLKNRKSRPKPKIKKHCIQMKVGGVEIPIR